MISFDFKTAQFKAATKRLRNGLRDFRGFWKHYKKNGNMATIQRDWFYGGGPDPKPLKKRTKKRRATGLFVNQRNSKDFYKALKAGIASKPDGGISPGSPKWVWTKNTLRSTYEQPEMKSRQMIFATGKFEKLTQPSTYRRFRGPFAKYMPDHNKVWNMKAIEDDIAKELQAYFAKLIGGRAA